MRVVVQRLAGEGTLAVLLTPDLRELTLPVSLLLPPAPPSPAPVGVVVVGGVFELRVGSVGTPADAPAAAGPALAALQAGLLAAYTDPAPRGPRPVPSLEPEGPPADSDAAAPASDAAASDAAASDAAAVPSSAGDGDGGGPAEECGEAGAGAAPAPRQ